MNQVNEFNKLAVAEMSSSPVCFQKAETLLKKALSIDPNCGKAHYNLGVLYARQCNYYLAALEFEKAKNLNYDPEGNLDCILKQLGNYPDCEIQMCDKPTISRLLDYGEAEIIPSKYNSNVADPPPPSINTSGADTLPQSSTYNAQPYQQEYTPSPTQFFLPSVQYSSH
jgi:tetratricopeptide (TPR) repeat protein